MTSRPLSVGSFFTSRSRLRSNVRAVASSRSRSSRVTSRIEMKCRRAGGSGGRRSSRMTWMSPMLFLRFCDEQDLVDLVDLDELHLDPLVARGRKVLADVVGADRKLAVAAVGEDRQLHPRRAPVVEQRLDGGPDRPARVEDVVDEDAGAARERKVELRGADDRLRVQRGLATADVEVVPVEGDVHRADRQLSAGAVGDQAADSLRKRNATRL